MGKKSSKKKFHFSQEWAKAFHKVVGFNNSDTLLLTSLTRLRDTEFDLLEEMGIPLGQCLHGEQEYESFQSLTIGKEIEYCSEFTQFVEKKGALGSMVFLIFTTTFHNKSQLMAKSQTTLVYLKGKK